MTKADLVSQIAEKTGMTDQEAEQTLDAIMATITSALTSGDVVKLTGLGNLKTEQRAARQSRNPRTSEPITIPASKTVKFTPAKALKDAIHEHDKFATPPF